ncbi:sulfite exporter TauE/SafE family protein [Marinagarivorans algicola]|uniref:sulfite exporter TauE/SafE family protein n=1 Tax=Marinagarivorans algicola TaxID=1513270 RepID=UPI0006B8AC9F|nr:sulfite exporter TauE/SafE family protein [Marinagarivorans algicola]
MPSRHTLARDFYLILLYAIIVWALMAVFAWDSIWQALQQKTNIVAAVMGLGSFVAGATCLGGGAVAFPALTKMMGIDPFTAKSFSLAIQSAGMTSASLFILTAVKQLPWRFMALYLKGSLAGLLVALLWLDQQIAANDIRIIFTLFCLGFLIVFILANRHAVFVRSHINTHTYKSQSVIITFGLVGGLSSGLMGSGADLLAFCALAIYFRLSIRIATQVSILMMTANSLVGVAVQFWWLDNAPALTAQLWYAAVPVVIIGAPIGALVCKYISQRLLFVFVIILVTIEVMTTLWLIPVENSKIKYYAIVFIFALSGLFLSHWYPHKHLDHPQSS